MAKNIYSRKTADGTENWYSRKGTQGRKPCGLGKPKLYRLYSETNTKLSAIAQKLGSGYNETEIIREAARKHVDFIYTELVNT